jgi:hypothetical protein
MDALEVSCITGMYLDRISGTGPAWLMESDHFSNGSREKHHQ